MRNYDRVHPRKPAGIEERKAYIVGGGIAGLSAAAEQALGGCTFSAEALCRAISGTALSDEVRADLCGLIRRQNI